MTSPALSKVAHHVPFQPYSTVLAEQHAADELLLHVAPGHGSQGVYTGKVFEYVASKRPVLAMVPHDNVAGQLILDADAGTVVDPDDVSAIVEHLRSVHDTWLANGRGNDLEVPQSVLESISRRSQSAGLAQQILHIAR
jgi:hypothetical protein